MSSILDPEVKPSPAKEIVHKGKGCLAVIIAAAVLVFGFSFVWNKTTHFLDTFGEIPDYVGAGKAKIIVSIPEGSSLDAIGNILANKDVIKSRRAWDQAVRSEERATTVQAGSYSMKTQIPAIDALRLLINPGSSRVRAQFTIPEGLRLSAQITALVKGTKIRKAAYQAALKKPKSLGLPTYAKGRAEGYLFPETYELTADSTAATTLRQMVTEYKSVSRAVGVESAAKTLKVSPHEVVTVASIIEREVNQDKYRAKVARVLYNRVDKGRKLELDSTVVYAEKLKTNTTTPKDRRSKSKYNTYRYKGLPPGPISAPGKASLQAAANPTKGKWLYFVTVNFDTGETKFARTEKGFLKIQAEFQQWCRANQGRCDS